MTGTKRSTRTSQGQKLQMPLPEEGRGHGEEIRSKESKLTTNQSTEVRQCYEINVSGRLKLFFPAKKKITSDRTVLDMVQHSY